MTEEPIRREAITLMPFSPQEELPFFFVSKLPRKFYGCRAKSVFGERCGKTEATFVIFRGGSYTRIDDSKTMNGLEDFACSATCAQNRARELSENYHAFEAKLKFCEDGVVLGDPKVAGDQELAARSNTIRLIERFCKTHEDAQRKLDEKYKAEMARYCAEKKARRIAYLEEWAEMEAISAEARVRAEAKVRAEMAARAESAQKDNAARSAQESKLAHYGDQPKHARSAPLALELPEVTGEDRRPVGDDAEGAFECSVCEELRTRKFLFACGHGPLCAVCIHGMAERAKERLCCHVCDAPVSAVIRLFF